MERWTCPRPSAPGGGSGLSARGRREDMKFQKLGDVHVPGLGVPGVPCKVYRSVCHQV